MSAEHLSINLIRSSVIEEFQPLPELDDPDNSLDKLDKKNDLTTRHCQDNNRDLETQFLLVHGGTVRSLLYPLPHRQENEMTTEERLCNLPATDSLKLSIVKISDESDVFLVKETINCDVCGNAMKLYIDYLVDGRTHIYGKNKDR